MEKAETTQSDVLAASGHEGAAQAEAELLRMRASIDNIDAAVIHMLAERFKATKRVGQLKARYSLPASDPSREAQQIHRLKQLAQEADLDPVFAEQFLNFIVREVIRHHQRISEDYNS